MIAQFQWTAGSIIGTAHTNIAQNNQDAHLSIERERYTLHLVADGCGDPTVGFYSEIGSNLGVRIVAQAIESAIQQRIPPTTPQFWHLVKKNSLHHLYDIALRLGNPSQVFQTHFLFTILGILITDEDAVVFGIGDGVYYINGIQTFIGPFPDNKPPYLAYAHFQAMHQPLLDFQIHTVLKTADLATFLIGTDGVIHLIYAAQKQVPGETELVGPIEQVWEDEYFESPYALPLRLKVLATTQYIWTPRELQVYPGVLPDDTTLIVGRKVV